MVVIQGCHDCSTSLGEFLMMSVLENCFRVVELEKNIGRHTPMMQCLARLGYETPEWALSDVTWVSSYSCWYLDQALLGFFARIEWPVICISCTDIYSVHTQNDVRTVLTEVRLRRKLSSRHIFLSWKHGTRAPWDRQFLWRSIPGELGKGLDQRWREHEAVQIGNTARKN